MSTRSSRIGPGFGRLWTAGPVIDRHLGGRAEPLRAGIRGGPLVLSNDLYVPLPGEGTVIIFGLSVFYFGLIGTGQFHCPHCGGDREYKHRTARRFFTLFFVPVIPLDKVGEVVRCQTCKKRFDPVVLERPTTAQMSLALPAGMRAAAAVVLRAGGASEPASRAAVDAVRRTGMAGYGAAELHADLHQPVEAAEGPLRALAAQLTQEACERYLAATVQIGLADGPLKPAERNGILWVAHHLGMTPAHAQGVIAVVEQSVSAG